MLKLINPLQVMSRLSQRTLEKTHTALLRGGFDEMSRINLSVADKSQVVITKSAAS